MVLLKIEKKQAGINPVAWSRNRNLPGRFLASLPDETLLFEAEEALVNELSAVS